jgi:hypothetical protein
MLSAPGDDIGSTDLPSDDGANAYVAGVVFTAMTGQDYREVVGDVKSLENCLHHPNAAYRGLALGLCRYKWHPSTESMERILEMAGRDPNESVRIIAITVLASLDLAAKANRFLRFFATLALDVNEPDQVRKAAYQSAVLSGPDCDKTRHIFKHRKYLITNVITQDFDFEYLRGLIVR